MHVAARRKLGRKICEEWFSKFSYYGKKILSRVVHVEETTRSGDVVVMSAWKPRVGDYRKDLLVSRL